MLSSKTKCHLQSFFPHSLWGWSSLAENHSPGTDITLVPGSYEHLEHDCWTLNGVVWYHTLHLIKCYYFIIYLLFEFHPLLEWPTHVSTSEHIEADLVLSIEVVGKNRRIRTTTTTARPGSWGCLFSQCCLLKPCLFGARDCLWLHSVFWQVFLMSLKIPLQQGWAVKWCSGHWLLIGCQSFALWKLLTIIVAPLKPSPLFCITHRYSFQIKESK